MMSIREVSYTKRQILIRALIVGLPCLVLYGTFKWLWLGVPALDAFDDIPSFLFLLVVLSPLAFCSSNEQVRGKASATRALTPEQRLRAIPVAAKMISRERMIARRLAQGQEEATPLAELMGAFDIDSRGGLILFVGANDAPAYVLRKEAIERFLVEQAHAETPVDVRRLTLGDLLDYGQNRKLFASQFGVVPANATLAEAKAVMERAPARRDVFVTEHGAEGEPVLGWITGECIEQSSRA